MNITNTVTGIAQEKLFINDLCLIEDNKIRHIKTSEYELNDPLPDNFCSPINNYEIGEKAICATVKSVIVLDED